MWLPCDVILEKAAIDAPISEETQPKPLWHIPMPKNTCEVPVILTDATIPATEGCVQIHPNVCLRGHGIL